MPELPEVETVRRQLAPSPGGPAAGAARGARRPLVRARAPRRGGRRGCRPPRSRQLRRRGKYLSPALEDEVFLVMHLRMTGNLLLVARPTTTPTTGRTCARASTLDDGTRVLFVDQRRFGTGIVLLGRGALDDYFAARLGVEPLGPDFTAGGAAGAGGQAPRPGQGVPADPGADRGRRATSTRTRRCFAPASTRCGRSARSSGPSSRRCATPWWQSLEAGIDARGATIDDFRHADGARGSFQDRFLVHRREGEPCPRCGTPDPQDARGRAGHLRLPALPAAAASGDRRAGERRSRRQQLLEAAVAVGLDAARGSRRSRARRPRSGGRSSGP